MSKSWNLPSLLYNMLQLTNHGSVCYNSDVWLKVCPVGTGYSANISPAVKNLAIYSKWASLKIYYDSCHTGDEHFCSGHFCRDVLSLNKWIDDFCSLGSWNVETRKRRINVYVISLRMIRNAKELHTYLRVKAMGKKFQVSCSMCIYKHVM